MLLTTASRSYLVPWFLAPQGTLGCAVHRRKTTLVAEAARASRISGPPRGVSLHGVRCPGLWWGLSCVSRNHRCAAAARMRGCSGRDEGSPIRLHGICTGQGGPRACPSSRTGRWKGPQKGGGATAVARAAPKGEESQGAGSVASTESACGSGRFSGAVSSFVELRPTLAWPPPCKAGATEAGMLRCRSHLSTAGVRCSAAVHGLPRRSTRLSRQKDARLFAVRSVRPQRLLQVRVHRSHVTPSFLAEVQSDEPPLGPGGQAGGGAHVLHHPPRKVVKTQGIPVHTYAWQDFFTNPYDGTWRTARPCPGRLYDGRPLAVTARSGLLSTRRQGSAASSARWPRPSSPSASRSRSRGRG